MELLNFESLPLPDPLLKGIRDAKFKTCTPIQSKSLPITLARKDLAGQAQTGTGKTAAFLITLFTRLLENKPEPAAKGKEGPRARGPSLPFAAGSGLFSRSRVKRVIKKAAVLPVPVCACPARSFRAKVIGRDLL